MTGHDDPKAHFMNDVIPELIDASDRAHQQTGEGPRSRGPIPGSSDP